MLALDTNIASCLFRVPSPSLEQKLKAAASSGLFLSSIVEAEMRYGIAKKRLKGTKLAGLIDQFLTKVRNWVEN